MSLRYFANGMPSRSTALRKSSLESLLSSRDARERALDLRVVDANAGFLRVLQEHALGDEPLEQLLFEDVGRRRRDVRGLHLAQHDALLLVDVVLRQRLVVDDGDHAVDRDHAVERRAAAGRRRAPAPARCRAARRRAPSPARARRRRSAAAQRAASAARGKPATGKCAKNMPDLNIPERLVAKTRRHGWIVGLLVAGDAAAQEIERVSPEPRQSVQFDLQIDRIRRRLRGRRQSLADEPQGPAVGIVLDAGHGLQRLAVEEREVPPAEQRPARIDGQLPRQVELVQPRGLADRVDELAGIGVARVEDPSRRRACSGCPR